MRTLLICLGAIVLIVILGIAGCVGIGYLGVSSLIHIPDYITEPYILDQYESDINKIRSQLKNKKTLNYSENKLNLNEDVLGIFEQNNDSFMTFEDVYKKHSLRKLNHSFINGIGSGTVELNEKIIHCLIYEISENDKNYFLFIKDHKHLEIITEGNKFEKE